MAVLKIGGVAMPAPSDMTVGRFDLSSSEAGRTQDGKMQKDIVARKVKLTLSWNALDWTDCSVLLNAVETAAFLDVTYPDPKAGTYLTKKMYVGDRTAPALTLVNGKEKWEGISFDLIEQ